MMNPIQPRTHNFLVKLGELIRDLAASDRKLPDGARTEAGRIVVSADAFRALMAARGCTEGDPDPESETEDYALRPDVREVEFVLRGDGRASVLLPEAAMIDAILDGRGPEKIGLATLYRHVADGSRVPAIAPDEPATYGITLPADDPFGAFIGPHLGYYTCTQCGQ